MTKRKTAGELSLKAASDHTKYDPLEVGHALTDDIVSQLLICAETHDKIFDMDEYCLILIIAGDPLIAKVRRHKYTAFPYLPQPRPQQAVFLWNKPLQKMKFLWSLPDAKVMAIISEMNYVAQQWVRTKGWCDAFYKGQFFEHIRKQHGINIQTETEFLNANRDKLIQAGCKEVDASFTDPFDFSKIHVDHIVDTKTARIK